VRLRGAVRTGDWQRADEPLAWGDDG